MLLNTDKTRNVGQGAYSNDMLDRWRKARWRGRTDLYYLAHDILGYNEQNYSFGISKDVHQPLIDRLQQFPMPDLQTAYKLDLVRPGAAGGCIYPYGGKPAMNRKNLPGPRRRLILAPRSFFKTTINCVAHTIQWLLNYPDISILMVQASTMKAELNLQEVKSHFLFNSLFRSIYPDYCPSNPKKDFGNRTQFTLPNRQNRNRKEPTVLTASVDMKTAGLHVEVIKCSDIVEDANTRTSSQMDQTAYSFDMFKKLLVDPDDHIDLEGTRYDYSDLYGRTIDSEKKRAKEGKSPIWSCYIQGIYEKDIPYEKHRFDIPEMELPYKRDKDGNFVSHWPKRFSVEMLEGERFATPEAEDVFATQMLNDPLAATGRQVFDLKDMTWIDRDEFAKVKIVFRTVTVDTAETQSDRSDYTAITTAAWDRGGRCYIEDIRYGRMHQDAIVEQLFMVWQKFKPVSIKIEETGFVRGLRPTITRLQERLGVYPVFEFIPRDTQVSKNERIRGIQPWFKSGDLRFLSDLKYKQELTDQLGRFDKYKFDDILDTIADQFQNREHFGRLVSRPTADEVYAKAKARLLLGEVDEPQKFDDVQMLTGL